MVGKSSPETLLKAKLYRDAHKAEAKLYRDENYAENKEKIISSLLKPVKCECGFECGIVNLKRHKASHLHVKRLLAEKNTNEAIQSKIEKMELEIQKLKSLIV